MIYVEKAFLGGLDRVHAKTELSRVVLDAMRRRFGQEVPEDRCYELLDGVFTQQGLFGVSRLLLEQPEDLISFVDDDGDRATFNGGPLGPELVDPAERH